ncbi:Bud-site selection protein [Dipodascopsis uninucleata]
MTSTQDNHIKRKRENVLWELDLIESQLSQGSKKPRLVRTKLLVDRIRKEQKKEQKLLKQQQGNEVSLETDTNAEQDLEKRANELRKKLVEQRIYHGIRELARAIKKSKPLEKQKVARKVKEARVSNNADLIAKHELFLNTISSIDPTTVAQSYLWKRFQKNGFLRSSSLLPEAPKLFTPCNDGEAYHDIVARLFKLSGVQQIANRSMEGVTSAVEVALGKRKSKLMENGKFSDDLENSGNNVDKNEDYDETDDEEVEAENEIEEHGVGIGSDEDPEELSELDDVLDVDLGHPHRHNREEEEEAHIMSQKLVKKEKGSTKKQPIVLPSLHGGYLSGSEDDDIEDDDVARDAVAPARKNRRGQRARQKLWEKKYGKEAKHLQKKEFERKQKQERWLERQQKREQRSQEVNNREQSNGAGSEKDSHVFSNVDDKPLHPSWELRQKQNKLVEFKGKKTVFD